MPTAMFRLLLYLSFLLLFARRATCMKADKVDKKASKKAKRLGDQPLLPRMRRCSIADLHDAHMQNGTWVSTPNEPARYRLYRDLQRNPLVKGWAFGMRRFWGMCDEGFPDHFSREEAQSRWQPSSCKLHRFDAPKLCEHLVPSNVHDNPEILFVGDSYTGQLFISFISLMKGSIYRNEGDAPRTLPTMAWIRVGGERESHFPISELQADALACVDETTRGKKQRPPLRVSFIRNEFILPEMKTAKSNYRHGYAWLPRVKKNTILVIQVTAWLGSDARSLNERVGSIAAAVRGPMKNYTHQTFIMSPSRGHVNCKATTGYGVVVPPKGPNASQLTKTQLMHEAGMEITRKHGLTYVDMTTPLNNRSDGHMPSDCGHWCLPGPYDLGADLLFHALLSSRMLKSNSAQRRGASQKQMSPIEDLRNSDGYGVTVQGKFSVDPLASHLTEKLKQASSGAISTA